LHAVKKKKQNLLLLQLLPLLLPKLLLLLQPHLLLQLLQLLTLRSNLLLPVKKPLNSGFFTSSINLFR
jgi:hypothetical protein